MIKNKKGMKWRRKLQARVGKRMNGALINNNKRISEGIIYKKNV